MVIVPPTGPAGGCRLVITGLITVNIEAAVVGLEIEFTGTVTGPVPFGAELGTKATNCAVLQFVMDVAGAPLNLTVLVPWAVPKFDPVMVTEVPMDPPIGGRRVTKG